MVGGQVAVPRTKRGVRSLSRTGSARANRACGFDDSRTRGRQKAGEKLGGNNGLVEFWRPRKIRCFDDQTNDDFDGRHSEVRRWSADRPCRCFRVPHVVAG